MNKNSMLIFVITLLFSGVSHGSTWCSGKVTNIRLNTDYNNNQISYTINGVVAVLEEVNWSNEMKDKALSALLAAQMADKNVSYWGSDDCTLIKNRLNVTSN